MSVEVAVLGNAQLHASGVEQGVEGPVDNALRTDVHPSAGGHLSVVCHTHLCGNLPVLDVVEHADHHGVGDDDARCLGLRLEQAQRVAAFHHERLLVGHDFQVLLDEAVLHPVLADLSGLAVGHQFIGIERDVETQVVVNHYLESLAFDAVAFIFVDGFGFEVALRTETVTVDFSAGQQLVHELGGELFVQFFRDVAKCVLQGCGGLCGSEAVPSVRSTTYAFHECGILR